MQQTGELEILAAVVVYFSLLRELRGRRVVHYIDNSSALAPLVKRSSSALDSSYMIHAFWALVSFLEIDVWFEFLYSKANISDWPSRGDWVALVDKLRAKSIEPVLPPEGSWREIAQAVHQRVSASDTSTSAYTPAEDSGVSARKRSRRR